MSVNKKQALMPRLRFPEFHLPWEPKELGPYLKDYSQRVAGDTDLPVYSSTRSGLKLQKEYFDGKELLNQGEYGVVQTGHFVYRHMSDDGAFKFNINETGSSIAVSKEYPTFSANGIHPKFLFQKLNEGRDFAKFAFSQKKGGTRTRLYFSTLCSWSTALPEYDEQTKIADCLSSLDDLITAETKKLETIKAHKKGLMQQLFPREGETVPRRRFPEFREAEKWVPKTVGGSCESFSGGTPSTTNKSFYGGEIPFIRSAEIDREKTELFLSNEGLANSAAKMVKIGDILVALYGANSGDVALSKVNGAINQAILCLRHETNNIFVYQYLTHKKDWIIATFIQGGQGNLSGEIIKAIGLFFPKPKEQQRIADCLSSLDDLITAQSQKIDALKTHKKGLMQQLFPALDEVSA